MTQRLLTRTSMRLTAALSIVAAGCSPAITVRVVHRDQPRKASALAVYPFEFRWSEAAYRSFQLGWAEAIDLANEARWSIYGPGEFHVRETTDDNVFAATDIASTLTQQGVRADEILVIRGWAEKQEQRSSRQIYDSNGKPMGQRLDAQITLIAHLEVVDPISREVIAEVQGTGQEDPFAAPDEADPSPVLTGLVRGMSARLNDALTDLAPGVPVTRSLPIRTCWNPTALYQFEDQGRPSLESQLASLDAVSREALRSSPVRFFAHDLTDAQVTELQHLPGGLWVARVEGEPNGLEVGDLITGVENESATPLSLARALRRAKPGIGLNLTVRHRSGDHVPLKVTAVE